MKELSFEEMEMITGGGWLSDAWDWITSAVNTIVGFLESLFHDQLVNAVNNYNQAALNWLMKGGSLY